VSATASPYRIPVQANVRKNGCQAGGSASRIRFTSACVGTSIVISSFSRMAFGRRTARLRSSRFADSRPASTASLRSFESRER
jgi:hypothetical protein